LIVDSDQTVRNSLTRLLRRNGFDAATSARAGGALRRLRSGETFDCIITDILLPDLFGRAFVGRLSEDKLFDLSRIVILTRVHSVDNATAYLQYGCAAYLGKPYENDVIIDQVQRICNPGVSPKALKSFM
jgi:FixJ family two-component response regulator